MAVRFLEAVVKSTVLRCHVYCMKMHTRTFSGIVCLHDIGFLCLVYYIPMPCGRNKNLGGSVWQAPTVTYTYIYTHIQRSSQFFGSNLKCREMIYINSQPMQLQVDLWFLHPAHPILQIPEKSPYDFPSIHRRFSPGLWYTGRNPAPPVIMKTCETWDILHINWLAGFLPSTVW